LGRTGWLTRPSSIEESILDNTDFPFGGTQMRILSRAIPLLALTAVAAANSVQAQSASSKAPDVAQIRDNRFKWFFGAQAGAMVFETSAQSQTGVPAFGAHLAVVSHRGGLMVGVDEAIGSGESASFVDEGSGGINRSVTFDRLRRYGFNMTGYPVRGKLEPYLGLGFGLLQVINPQLGGVFTSPTQAAESADEADQKSATGFMSFLAGVQFRVGRMAAFGQYQISTSPSEGNLLRGPGHLIMGGLRFSLGSSKENVKGGGY
jgi:hypothetical protein